MRCGTFARDADTKSSRLVSIKIDVIVLFFDGRDFVRFCCVLCLFSGEILWCLLTLNMISNEGKYFIGFLCKAD